jgi:putative peptide maturation system protein
VTTSLQQSVLDTLEWLMGLSRDGIRPEEALGRLANLRHRHAHIPLDLLWEEDAFDRFVHYDALLRLPEGGTISLSFCPARALPWPLRGVHRWSDSDLVRVNGRVLRVDQAIALLDFVWDEARLVERLLDVCLVQEALDREPIELSDAELQREMDAFRRARRLHTAAATRQWMDHHGITHRKLEEFVAGQAVIARLRERVTAGRVDEAFAARRAEFDTVRIARFDLPDEEEARRVANQIRSGQVSFYEAAELHFLKTTGEGAVPPRPLFQVIQRRQVPAPFADALFAAAPNEVVGPIRAAEGHALIRVLSSTRACLDAPTRSAIEEMLFAEWLTEKRQTAAIEWCWGNARQTTRAVSPVR